MNDDGTCPTCGGEVAAQQSRTAKNLDLKALASSTTIEDDDEGAPWHFKLLMVALIAYLAWRFIDLFV
jgi:hypothetical protein